MTVFWHVYDLKVSDKDDSSIYEYVLKIYNIFGIGIKVSRDEVHEYLVMDIYWSQDATMIVSMIKYLQKIIDYFSEVIRSTSTTYASEYLFTV